MPDHGRDHDSAAIRRFFNEAAADEEHYPSTIDPRILADWKNGGWTMPAGEYTFALGKDAETLGTPVKVRMPAKTWKD